MIEVSSKGQVTIPSGFREGLSLSGDIYLYVARAASAAGVILGLLPVDHGVVPRSSGVGLVDVCGRRVDVSGLHCRYYSPYMTVLWLHE